MSIAALRFSQLIRLVILFFATTCLLAAPHGDFACRSSAQDKPAGQSNSADLARARQLLDQGKTDDALALLTQISLREPKVPGLARDLGVAYYKKSDFAQAIPHLRQALDEGRPNEAVPDHRRLLAALAVLPPVFAPTAVPAAADPIPG